MGATSLGRRRPSIAFFSNSATFLGLISAVLCVLDATLVVGITAGSIAIVLFGVSIVLQWRVKRRNDALVDRLRDLLDVDRVLDAAARHLNFGKSGGGWRMSVYELDVQKELWVLNGRASSNELYADSRDFPEMSHKLGVLRGCVNGSERPGGHFDEIPPLAEVEDQAWSDVLRAWGVSKGLSSALRMKSRSYCGGVFKVGPRDGHQMTLGIVAESESPTGVDMRVLEEGLTRPFFETLAELIKLRRHLERL